MSVFMHLHEHQLLLLLLLLLLLTTEQSYPLLNYIIIYFTADHLIIYCFDYVTFYYISLFLLAGYCISTSHR